MREVKPKFLDAMYVFTEEMGRSCNLLHSSEKTNMPNMIKILINIIISLKSLQKSYQYPQNCYLWCIRTPRRIFTCMKDDVFSWIFESNHYSTSMAFAFPRIIFWETWNMRDLGSWIHFSSFSSISVIIGFCLPPWNLFFVCALHVIS